MWGPLINSMVLSFNPVYVPKRILPVVVEPVFCRCLHWCWCWQWWLGGTLSLCRSCHAMPAHGSSLFNTISPNFFPNLFSLVFAHTISTIFFFFYRLLLNSQKIASSQKCRKFCHQVQLTNLEGRDFRKYIIASFAIYLRYMGILRPISATSRPLLYCGIIIFQYKLSIGLNEGELDPP